MKFLPCLCLCLLLPGCAFARRENRPVWNAFEQHLVPEDRTGFLLALPLTVPGGLLAILTDTFVAHPIQVADDAWDDAASLWRNGRPDFDDRYYSEMAFLPLRSGLTPVTFLGSFLGRSMFDVESKADAAAAQAQRAAESEAAAVAEAQRLRVDFAAWLTQLRAGSIARWPREVPELDDELRAALRDAPQHTDALGRLCLFHLSLHAPAVATVVPWEQGLRDPDPGVRFLVLRALPANCPVPDDLRQQLLQDPVESIRLTAQDRWPAPEPPGKQP